MFALAILCGCSYYTLSDSATPRVVSDYDGGLYGQPEIMGGVYDQYPQGTDLKIWSLRRIDSTMVHFYFSDTISKVLIDTSLFGEPRQVVGGVYKYMRTMLPVRPELAGACEECDDPEELIKEHILAWLHHPDGMAAQGDAYLPTPIDELKSVSEDDTMPPYVEIVARRK